MRQFLSQRRIRALLIGLLAFSLLLVALQLVGAWYIRRTLSQLAARNQREVSIGSVWVLWPGSVSLSALSATHAGTPFASVAQLDVEYSLGALLLGDLSVSRVAVQGASLSLSRDKEGHDNFSDLLAKRASNPDGARSGASRGLLANAELVVDGASVRANLLDETGGTELVVGGIQATLPAHGLGTLSLEDVSLAEPGQAPEFAASAVQLYLLRDGTRAELAGISLLQPKISLSREPDLGLPLLGARAALRAVRPSAVETSSKEEPGAKPPGAGLGKQAERLLALVPTLEMLDAEITVQDGPAKLTVHGVSARATVVRTASGADAASSSLVSFHASGGAPGNDAGWSADGSFDPARLSLSLRLDADHVGLKDFSPYLEGATFVDPGAASFDLELQLEHTLSRELYANGRFAVEHLNVDHPRLASKPLRDVSFEVGGEFRYNVQTRDLDLRNGILKRGKALVTVEGTVQHQKAGSARYKFHAAMPKINCGDLFAAVPPDLIPTLEGFKLGGTFLFDLNLDLDTRSLDEMTLEGDLDLNRCKVLSSGDQVRVSLEELRDGTFLHRVEEPDGKVYEFEVGKDSSDWTPLDDISPYLVQGILTTEDGAFYSHKGFMTVQVLRSVVENVAAGRFKRGASTITMQFVKNTLLSREKTISRKLQEMVLTWWVEQNLTKERILTLYFNLIEFGPGIYGIHDASEHYFETLPRLLNPWQSAYLLSIIPNPKKYHKMFEENDVPPSWTARVRRILTHMHSKGRLTDEEYNSAMLAPIVFGQPEEPTSGPSSAPATPRDPDE